MLTDELNALIARYGPTACRDVELPLDRSGHDYWLYATERRTRRAEVVMVVQRPDGKVLLHTKTIYPEGVFRLPTGGVTRKEGIEEALEREQWEELGMQLPVQSMPGIVRWQFRSEQQEFSFLSLLFVLKASSGFWPEPQDASEQISGFRWVPAQDLAVIGAQLHPVDYLFPSWGVWRAVPHELLAEAMVSHKEGYWP